MRINSFFLWLIGSVLIVMLTLWSVVPVCRASEAQSKPFSQEQLEQILAPVALYPDSLLTQILMASTYPLEVVKAMNWLKQNKNVSGDALTRELEKQNWDPSVKSLMNFPQVLQMMSDQIEWTQRLGDAFLAQQRDVMNTVQKLRKKAQDQGSLKTTKEQKVVVEKETQTIIIEPVNPQVVYVPTYNPTVVYGVWAYPAYPPYPVYPPGYVATTAAFSFAAGVAVGAAWGYAWGHADWHGGDVNINVNQNININNNINREKYQHQSQGKGQMDQSGKGAWQHDPGHRQGVAYRDNPTAQRYGQQTAGSSQVRNEARGYSGDLGSGGRQGGSVERGPGRETPMGGGAGSGRRESAFSGAGNGRFERTAGERGRMSRGGGGRR